MLGSHVMQNAVLGAGCKGFSYIGKQLLCPLTCSSVFNQAPRYTSLNQIHPMVSVKDRFLDTMGIQNSEDTEEGDCSNALYRIA